MSEPAKDLLDVGEIDVKEQWNSIFNCRGAATPERLLMIECFWQGVYHYCRWSVHKPNNSGDAIKYREECAWLDHDGADNPYAFNYIVETLFTVPPTVMRATIKRNSRAIFARMQGNQSGAYTPRRPVSAIDEPPRPKRHVRRIGRDIQAFVGA